MRLLISGPRVRAPQGAFCLGSDIKQHPICPLSSVGRAWDFYQAPQVPSNLRAAGSSPAGGFMWINTIQQEQTNQTFLLFFGPYGTGVLRPILRERATFSTLNQTGICMWQQNKFCFRSSVGRACDSYQTPLVSSNRRAAGSNPAGGLHFFCGETPQKIWGLGGVPL